MIFPAEPRTLAPAPKVNKFNRLACRVALPPGACHLNPGKWFTCQDKSRGLGVHGKRISLRKDHRGQRFAKVPASRVLRILAVTPPSRQGARARPPLFFPPTRECRRPSLPLPPLGGQGASRSGARRTRMRACLYKRPPALPPSFLRRGSARRGALLGLLPS